MAKHIVYKTKGVCSQEMQFDLEEDGTVNNIKIIGGCRGNTQGVARLASGRKAEEIISLLKGIDCRGGNSCPNQLAIAVEHAISEQ